MKLIRYTLLNKQVIEFVKVWTIAHVGKGIFLDFEAVKIFTIETPNVCKFEGLETCTFGQSV